MVQAVVRRGHWQRAEGRRRVQAPSTIYRAVWRGAAAATAAGKTPPSRQAGAPPPTGRAEKAPSTSSGRMAWRRCRDSGGKTTPPRQEAPARPTIERRASVAARLRRQSERTLGTLEPKDRQTQYKERFAATNAPPQLRRHCEARRVMTSNSCQSRAQVTGRASGVSCRRLLDHQRGVRYGLSAPDICAYDTGWVRRICGVEVGTIG
jgi:hypothetical protein